MVGINGRQFNGKGGLPFKEFKKTPLWKDISGYTAYDSNGEILGDYLILDNAPVRQFKRDVECPTFYSIYLSCSMDELIEEGFIKLKAGE